MTVALRWLTLMAVLAVYVVALLWLWRRSPYSTRARVVATTAMVVLPYAMLAALGLW